MNAHTHILSSYIQAHTQVCLPDIQNAHTFCQKLGLMGEYLQCGTAGLCAWLSGAADHVISVMCHILSQESDNLIEFSV